jgi:hypothetical protein
MSQFWQNTQRRLHMEKNTVPLPFQPCNTPAAAAAAVAEAAAAAAALLH